MAESGIYEIVNLVNGKRYVGSALKLSQRWNKHRCELGKRRHHSKHLQSSWDKHGASAFEFRVLEFCGRDVLLDREQFHIDQGCDYNKCLVAGSPLGVRHSQESRRKMSERRRGRKKSPAHVAAMAEGAKTQWADPAIRARMISALRADWEARKSAGYVHPELTEEQRQKQREGVRASYTPELREKRSRQFKEMWAKRKARQS